MYYTIPRIFPTVGLPANSWESPPRRTTKSQKVCKATTYLKHQPQEENHSNTGNNICMVLDDKLVAHHGWVLSGLLSDRHDGAVVFDYMLRRSSRFLSDDNGITLQSEDTPSSLLLPINAGPGRQHLRKTNIRAICDVIFSLGPFHSDVM